MRKNWTYDPPITRRTVVDEYGAGPPEVARGSDRGVLRRGGKRDFSPYLNRGLGESHSTQYAVRKSTRVREYARKVCGPYLVDTKAGKSVVIDSYEYFTVSSSHDKESLTFFRFTALVQCSKMTPRSTSPMYFQRYY